MIEGLLLSKRKKSLLVFLPFNGPCSSIGRALKLSFRFSPLAVRKEILRLWCEKSRFESWQGPIKLCQSNMKGKNKSKLSQWQQGAENAICRNCGDPRGITVDHIIPASLISQLLAGDEQDILQNYEYNFQYLCNYCNYKKKNRIDPKDPTTFEILEHVIRIAKDRYQNP